MINNRKLLIVAYPGQGHINPSFRFAHLLLKMGVHVTFSSSFFALRSINKETKPHGLTFAPFSDGHDNGKQKSTTLEQFITDFTSNGAHAVEEMIRSAGAKGHPFDHLIYTTVVPWAASVANAHSVKSTLLWCQPAIILDIYYYNFSGYEDLISSNKNNPTFLINLPGIPPLTISDMPSFLFPSNPKEHDFILSLMKEHIDGLKTCPRVLINTFDELEVEAIAATDKIQFLPIGPLIPLEMLDEENSSTSNISYEKPVDGYVHWLNTKPKSSVVYVSFGSITTLSINQAEEMATGLLESRHPFLWVIRENGEAEKLSKINELEKQGMIVSWCSQVEVLHHQAIGCFVTHCGWNSTTEALVAGIPLVAFPGWSDQTTNAKMVEDNWKIGIKVRKREGEEMVEGKEIARCVQIVMKDEQMKKNAMKWKELATEALGKSGSSTLNLQAFLDHA